MYFEDIELKDCPFCGGKVTMEHTGRKEITVKCTSCYIKLTCKTLNHSLEWLSERMQETWNKRV